MIEVALLGCGGSMPIPNRYLTSLLINFRGRKILVDCGEGTQVSMKMLGWGFKTIDVICITHFHADHIVGLPGLLATIGNSGRVEPITIIGPSKLNEVINGLRVIIPYLPYELNLIEYDGSPFHFSIDSSGLKVNNELIEMSIDIIKLYHSSECLGYQFHVKRRPMFNLEKAIDNNIPKQFWNLLQKGETIPFEGRILEPNMVLGVERRGIKISYITDSRPFEELVPFIKESDLFFCEGMYGDEEDLSKAMNNKHMIFSEAANLALNGAVKELILTHFSPTLANPEMYLENAMKIFNQTTLGTDRLVRKLNFKEKNKTT